MRDLVEDPKTDLFAKIPGGDGQTILREALLVADHNAYHLATVSGCEAGAGRVEGGVTVAPKKLSV